MFDQLDVMVIVVGLVLEGRIEDWLGILFIGDFLFYVSIWWSLI